MASLLALSFTVSAGEGFTSSAATDKSGLANAASSEPCVNGSVSPCGLFNSQLEQNKAMTSMSVHSQTDSRLTSAAGIGERARSISTPDERWLRQIARAAEV
jgi:hypothetical protein